jgi:hypothetical protein
MPDALRPKPALLAKVGAIVVHADELLSPGGHAFDRAALRSLLDDPDVGQWLQEMRRMALVPRKRTE